MAIIILVYYFLFLVSENFNFKQNYLVLDPPVRLMCGVARYLRKVERFCCDLRLSDNIFSNAYCI